MNITLKILQEEFAKSARLLVIVAGFQILKHLRVILISETMAIRSYSEAWPCYQPTCKRNKTKKPQHLQLKNSTLVFCCPLKQFGKASLAQGWVFSANWEPVNALWLRLCSNLGCLKDVKRAEGDLWEMTWHFSMAANRIRKVMNCHWRFWYLLIKKTICMQYLQAAVAVYGGELFGWQSSLISSTQNLHCLFQRLSHPGLSIPPGSSSCSAGLRSCRRHKAGMDVHS